MNLSSSYFAATRHLAASILVVASLLVFAHLVYAGHLGDAANEGSNITSGSSQDSASTAVTYSFVSSNTTYTNTTAAMQQMTLTKVNFFAGTGSGTLIPFASIYMGDQTPAAIRNAANYKVVAVGKPVNVTGNSGLNHADFVVGGKNPTILLSPNQVLTVGFVSSSGQIVRNDGTASGTIDYVQIADTLPGKLPNAFTASSNQTLDRKLKFNVEYSVVTPAVNYIGDAASEGTSVLDGVRQDSAPTDVTYTFVSPGTTYANTTDFIQRVTFTEVNFYVGNNSGTLRPFVALYSGDQTPTAIKTASNYRVLLIGDTISVTAFSGRQNKEFLVAGQHPVIELQPNEVVSVGFLSSNGQLVRNDNVATGTIDYVTIANTIPTSVPNTLTANANQTLDRTVKFNVGFTVQNPPFYIGDDAAEGATVTSSSFQDSSSSPVTYAFVNPSSTYKNATTLMQQVYITDVNFYAGSNSGTLTPFAAVYNGDQSSTSIKAGANYRVLAKGDVINVTGNSGRQNRKFLVGGLSPTVSLEPGQTLAVGFLSSHGQVVRHDGTGTGAIDYVTIANTLPATVPNPLGGTANQNLDRTLKFNVGIHVRGGPFRVACIGDSITYGAELSDPLNKSYPAQMQALLGINYVVSNYGASGCTMLKNSDKTYWTRVPFANSLGSAPDIVVIMLGTNDSKPQNWTASGQAEYLPNYIEMINLYRALPSRPQVFVNTSPSVVPGTNKYSVDGAVINSQIVPLARQAAAATGSFVIDVNAGTQNIPLDFPDMVHPNEAGYLAIAGMVQDGLVGQRGIVSGGTYTIVGKYSGLSVDVTGGRTIDGAAMAIATSTNVNSQKWVLTAVEGGYYRITNVNSGKSAEATGGSGAAVVQRTYSGTASQQWQLNYTGLGFYRIVNRASGCVFDVDGAPGTNGTLIKQVTPSNTDDTQKFHLIRL